MQDIRRMEPIRLRTRLLEIEIAGCGRKPYSEIAARIHMVGFNNRRYQLDTERFDDLESAMKWAVEQLKTLAGQALMLSGMMAAEAEPPEAEYLESVQWK